METLQVPGVETESVVSAPMASTARGVTRVLLLADAPVLRRGLVSMINETAGMQSVGTPGELRRALTLVESARPDAVVVELGSGRAATLNACRDLRRRFPRVADAHQQLHGGQATMIRSWTDRQPCRAARCS